MQYKAIQNDTLLHNRHIFEGMMKSSSYYLIVYSIFRQLQMQIQLSQITKIWTSHFFLYNTLLHLYSYTIILNITLVLLYNNYTDKIFRETKLY